MNGFLQGKKKYSNSNYSLEHFSFSRPVKIRFEECIFSYELERFRPLPQTSSFDLFTNPLTNSQDYIALSLTLWQIQTLFQSNPCFSSLCFLHSKIIPERTKNRFEKLNQKFPCTTRSHSFILIEFTLSILLYVFLFLLLFSLLQFPFTI